MGRKIPQNMLISLAVGLVVLILDQLTKLWVVSAWPERSQHVVVDNFFSLVHWRNPGAAWGMFSEHTMLLGIVSAVVFILMLCFYRTLTEGHRMQELGFGLILGGVVGNLIDRLARGSVVDFLRVYHNSFEWPAFNVADSGITVGVTIYVISVLWHSWKGRAAKPAAS